MTGPLAHATLALLLPCAVLACDPAPSPSVLETIHLASFIDDQHVTNGKPLVEYVWNLQGDRRAGLFQHPPSTVQLGPFEGAAGCTLRFSTAINTAAWEHTDGMTFYARFEGAGPNEAPVLLFEEFLSPEKLGEPRWVEHEVALPSKPGESFHLQLETDAGPSGSAHSDHGAWANAHIECPRPRPERPALSKPHVILISLDTLRADHLGLYGYERDTSPVLDALAKESVVFDRAFSPAPWTLPSHASLFTGHYPYSHGAGHRNAFDPLGAELTTLADAFSAAGYRTGAFTGGGLMSSENGLARGFDVWHESIKGNFESELPRVLDFVGIAPEQPLFLFFHTYEIHGPYRARDGAPHLAAEGNATEPNEQWNDILALGHHHYQEFERFGSLDEVVAAYDAGIHVADSVLGRFFERLRELELYDEALIVVTSDHGESLYDRDLFVGHGFTLYDEDVRIPLLVRFPGARETGRSDALVDLVDLMPMLLDEAGVAAPEALQGSHPLKRAGKAAKVVQGGTAYSGGQFFRSADWKLITAPHPLSHEVSRVPHGIRDRFEAGDQLFDLREDPGEERRLSSNNAAGPQIAELTDRAQRTEKPGLGEFDAATLSPERAQQLRELGYVE